MENLLSETLRYNKEFVENKKYITYETSKNPNKKLVILSCMDTRLTELLPKALNIRNGDAKIIKNAGATVVHPFGSIVRSIVVAIYEFEVEDVMIVGHYGCGMSNINTDKIMQKIEFRGVDQERIQTLYDAGIDVTKWLEGFSCVEESVRESVGIIKRHPLVPRDIRVHGLIMHPETGEVEVVVDGSL